jgi:hypothetical protein
VNIFERAAEILMESGHCKHVNTKPTGERCAFGALWAASGGHLGYGMDLGYDKPDQWPLVGEAGRMAEGLLRLRGEINHPGGPVPDCLVEWNNADERTAEDVILLFKELGAEAAGE